MVPSGGSKQVLPAEMGPGGAGWGLTGTQDLEEGLAVGKFIPLHADTDPHDICPPPPHETRRDTWLSGVCGSKSLHPHSGTRQQCGPR